MQTTSKQKQDVQQEVMQLLHWDDFKYAEFQYNTGIDYLGFYIPHDRFSADLLTRSKIFWSWWRNHWANRDEQFIIKGMHLLKFETRLWLYQDLHDAETLALEIYPSGIVLGDTYKLMMQAFIDQTMQTV